MQRRRPDVQGDRRAGYRLLYAFGFFWMFLVVIPVIVPFLHARGLSTGEVLSSQAVFAGAVLLLDLPCGYLCDRIGARRCLALGALLNGIGYTAFALAEGFGAVCAVEAVLGVAWALVSGADVALLYGLADLAGADRGGRRRALADYQLAASLGEAVASLLGGALAWRSPAMAAAVGAVTAWVPLLLTWRLPEPARAPGHVSAGDLWRVVGELARARLRRLTFATMLAGNLATFVAVWLLQPFWQQRGIPLPWFGPLWAATLVTVGLVGRATPGLQRRCGAAAVTLAIAALPMLGYAGMAFAPGVVGLAACLLFYVSRGMNAVHLREAFNHHLPARYRASGNSLASGCFRLLYAGVGPLVGVGVDRAGLPVTLAGLAVACLVGLLAFAVPLARAEWVSRAGTTG